MESIFLLLSILICLIVSRGCINKIENFDPDKNYFENRISIAHVESTKVEYHNSYVVLTILNTSYALVRCGAPKPDGFERIIEVPVSGLTMTEGVVASLLSKLNLIQFVEATGDPQFIYNDLLHEYLLKKRLENKTLPIIYQDSNYEYDLEKIRSVNSEIVFTSSFNWKYMKNIPQAIIYAANDETSMEGKVEWSKIFSLFFQKEVEATNFVAGILSDYTDILSKVPTTGDKPKVTTGRIYTGYPPYDDYWAISSNTSYIADLIRDAGGDYIYGGDQNMLSIAEGLELVNRSDVWLNIDYYYDKTEELLAENDKFGDLNVVRKGGVWERSLRSRTDPVTSFKAYDILESGSIFPNLVLKDIFKILYPNNVHVNNIQFTYYKNINSLSPTSPVDFNNKSTYPKNCKLTDWSEWSSCNVQCGNGTESRHREVIQQSYNGGRSCDALNESRECERRCDDGNNSKTGVYVGVGISVAVVIICIALGYYFYTYTKKNAAKKLYNDISKKKPEEVKSYLQELI